MRKIEYLSPSSISLFYQNQQEFYLNYLCNIRAPRPQQTMAMAIGSSFDAYVKSYLHERLFGVGNDPKFQLNTLFEAQVESQCRDYVFKHGQYVFDCYKKSGALADLMLELSEAIGKPRFEMELKGVVDGYREGVTKDIKGITLLGKPDVFYINKHGANVILDFKVNGYMGTYNLSPMAGYVRLRGTGSKIGTQHRDCHPINHKGIVINAAKCLEDCNADWAAQLSIYAWLLGCNIGEDFITAIDQVCCNGSIRTGLEQYPEIKIAEHRMRINSEYQFVIFSKAQWCWEIVHSDHFFRELSKEDSQLKCATLDEMARVLNDPNADELSKWLLKSSRG